MRSWARLATGLAAMALAGPAAAQAWFVTPTPGPVSPPDQPTFHAGPASYGPAPAHVRPKDDTRGSLSGDKMMADLRRIVDFSLQPARRPWRPALRPHQRPAGGEGDRRLGGGQAKGLGPEGRPRRGLSLRGAALAAGALRSAGATSDGSPDVVLQSAMPIRNKTVKPRHRRGAVGRCVGRGSAARTRQPRRQRQGGRGQRRPRRQPVRRAREGRGARAGEARRGGRDQCRGELPATCSSYDNPLRTAATPSPASWWAVTTARSWKA